MTEPAAPTGTREVRVGADATALLCFGTLLAATSVLAVVARRRVRPGDGEVPPGGELAEWALAGRGYGPLRSWFLLGGSVFTAYTFVAVPALTYGVGALGFFAVPYTIVVFQLGYVLLPWLHRAAAVHGWVTPADAVRDRYGSSSLSLAVALTGILATMPYVALQLLGLAALLTVLGVPEQGPWGDLALTVTFAVLAVGTYRHGLRAPAVVAVVKGVAVFAVALGCTWLGLRAVHGPGALFVRADAVLHARTGAGLLLPGGLGSAYVTLAVGSALALLLYPHVLLPAFAARDADTLRRVSIGLLGWTALLGAVALAGVAALARGVRVPTGRAELAVPQLVHDALPAPAAGLVLGVVGIAALVPAAVMSVAAASTFASNVYLEYVNPTALPSQVTQVARVVSVVVKLGALAFVLGLRGRDAITLQLLGGVWILQTLPAVVIGLRVRRLHRYALLAGLLAGVVLGTVLVAAQGFVAVTRFSVGGHDVGVYAGLVALVANLAVACGLTPVLDAAGVPRGLDGTGLRLGALAGREWQLRS